MHNHSYNLPGTKDNHIPDQHLPINNQGIARNGDRLQAESDHQTELVNQYKLYVTWLQGAALSAHTIRNYNTQARNFVRFVTARNLKLSQSSIESILSQYRDELQHQHTTSPASICTKLKSVMRFLQFIGIVACIPAVDVPKQYGADVLSVDEIQRLLNSCSRDSNRHQLLVHLFLSAGLKLSEAANLELGDIQHNQGTLYLRIKSAAGYRLIAAGPYVATRLLAWLKERSSHQVANSSSYLFPSATGSTTAPAVIDFIVRRIGWRAGLTVSAQLLRNTCMAQMLDDSNDAHYVAQYVGLRSLELVKRFQRQPVGVMRLRP